LRNGGIILELDSVSSTRWLRQDANKANFLEKLEIPADFKDHRYAILIPFLPISFPIEEPDWLRAVEAENDLPEGSITTARWIKVKTRCTPDQRVAHAIFTLAEPKAANILLCDGLYICKEKLHPRKEKKDPLRCV
ncbi:hypothetical protein OG21DRAFT_1428696, partial [Imleria badia]